MKHLLYSQGVSYPKRFCKLASHWSRNFIKWLREEVVLLSEGKRTLLFLCDQVEHIREEILKITREIRLLSKSDTYRENFNLLSSVPGFGLITSMSLLTELDNAPTRYPSKRTFVSMLGLIPTCHDSGEKKSVVK